MQNAAADTTDVAALKAVIVSLQREVEHLRWQLAKVWQDRFGRSSERGDLLDQLPLYPETSIPVGTQQADALLNPGVS